MLAARRSPLAARRSPLAARRSPLATSFLVLMAWLPACPGAGVPVAQPESCKEAASLAQVVEGAPTYKQWKAASVARAENGTWILEGDILLSNEEQLRAMYLRYFAQPAQPGDVSFRSAVECRGKFDNVWHVSEKLDLTYCFGNFVTAGLEAQVRAELRRAASVWERAADVNFIEVAMSKEQCNCLFPADPILRPEDCPDDSERSGEAKFRVRQLVQADCHQTICQPASAHYPHAAGGDGPNDVQEILFNESSVDELPRHAIHELGHALGLVHEHLRWTQTLNSCRGARVWRGATERDPYSVMGYGPCPGIAGSSSPEFVSSRDRVGLAYLYNLPRTEFPSYTTAGADDILWYQQRRGKYVLWRALAQASMGAPIEFAEAVEFCPDGEDAEDCDWALGDRRRVKPFPVSITAAHLTDVIVYGPEEVSDAALIHTTVGPLAYTPGAIPSSFDLPIVGRFFMQDASEEVWWVRPGESSDHIGTFAGTYSVPMTPGSEFGIGVASNGWYLPLVGLWAPRGSRRPNSQVLWLHERSQQFRLSYQRVDGLLMEEAMLTPACLFFENVRQPLALRGDFDGDDFPEIFWVSLSNGRHVLWRDPARMWSTEKPTVNCEDPAVAAVVMDPVDPPEYRIDLTFVKPFVGDFDGDGLDDIFWYTPGSSPDVIWTNVGNLDEQAQAIVPLRFLPMLDGAETTIDEDLTPFVGDFNGDGCDDIFWFAPHRDWIDPDPTEGTPNSSESVLWRANCSLEFTGFTTEVDVPVAPIDAYPVGFDPRVSGRHSELSLPEDVP